MINLALTVVSLVGILIFLFLFWRSLKEDYSSTLIFNSASFIIAGLLVGHYASKLIPESWFWMSLVASFLGLTLGAFKYKMRLTESYQAYVVGLMPYLALIFGYDGVVSSSLTSLIASVVTILLLVGYFFVDSRYKNFKWYKSGRVGFSGLATSAVFFLLRAIVAIVSPPVISFFGNFEVYLSSIVSFILFLSLYNLSRVKS